MQSAEAFQLKQSTTVLFEALPPLVSIGVVFAVMIGTWAVFQVGLAIWQRRRAKQNP
jgi:hypothetical protein